MIIGMDFGTTNSGMAVYDGKQVSILPLDPSNPNPRVIQTAMYIMNDQSIHIGRTAVDSYFNQNIGRAVKLQRIWIGELEVYAEDLYYVTDAYAWVDVLSPGRLFLSIKSSLRDENYPGTVIGQFYYSLENLIALYLHITKLRAEKLLGQDLHQIVLGRPVRFAFDPEHDALAQSRLLQAAFNAGYKKVHFQYEPIAAAYSYETTLDKPENVLVFDFGGGTLDITIMRLGDPQRRDVLATGGIPIAGDVFDQKLVRRKLPRHFGEGSFYGPRHKQLTVPQWIYDSFNNWQTMLELQTSENKQILQEIARTAQRRYQIEMLINLVSSNYGLRMFDIMEQAKRTLSNKRGVEVLLEGEGFQIRDFVTRSEFENIIRTEIRAVSDHLDEVVAQSGLAIDQIDAIIRTGGSSQVPAFYEMLVEKFGAAKIRSIDTFSSVTAGLGIIAHRLEQGEIDLPAYTPDMVKPHPDSHKPNVSPINLEIMQKRLAVEEGTAVSPATQSEKCIVVRGAGTEIVAVPAMIAGEELAISDWQAQANFQAPIVAILQCDWDTQLLLITNKYRFLLVTPRQLADLQSSGLGLTDLHHLNEMETVCTLSNWDEMLTHEKLLLTTSLGYARAYPLDVLRANIEAPLPLLFDHPPLGEPVTAVGVNNADQLVMVTKNGRGARQTVKNLRISGLQLLNCRTDRVTSTAIAQPEDQLLIITEDGYGRRLWAELIPIPEKANTMGKSLVARQSAVVAVTNLNQGSILLITNERLNVTGNGRLPLENSTKTYPLAKLGKGEMIVGMVHPDQKER